MCLQMLKTCTVLVIYECINVTNTYHTSFKTTNTRNSYAFYLPHIIGQTLRIFLCFSSRTQVLLVSRQLQLHLLFQESQGKKIRTMGNNYSLRHLLLLLSTLRHVFILVLISIGGRTVSFRSSRHFYSLI